MYHKVLTALVFVTFFCAMHLPAYAEEPEIRSIKALKSVGFNKCAAAGSSLSKFLNEKDDSAYLNIWNQENADKSTALTLTSEPYSDGMRFTAIAVSPTVGGTCDGNFVHLLVLSESCTKLRETTFKNWKYYMDLGSMPLYEDPTTTSVLVGFATLQPNSCLVIKTGMLFLKADQKK